MSKFFELTTAGGSRILVNLDAVSSLVFDRHDKESVCWVSIIGRPYAIDLTESEGKRLADQLTQPGSGSGH